MLIALSEEIDWRLDPIVVVENVLKLIAEKKDKLGIPFFKEFVTATGGLQRRGVTFVVTLEKGGQEELVPLRVENAKIIRTLHCKKEDLISWKRKFIHPIDTKYCRTVADVLRKVANCLKISLRRFVSRIQKIARNSGVQVKSAFVRTESGREPYRRAEAHQCGHH